MLMVLSDPYSGVRDEENLVLHVTRGFECVLCMEVLQSFLTPLAKSVRYMALPNWHDYLDDAIGVFALRKCRGFAEGLVKVR